MPPTTRVSPPQPPTREPGDEGRVDPAVLASPPQVPQAVGASAGPAEEVATLVPVDGGTRRDPLRSVTCPNCKRVWPVNDRQLGAIIPCLCSHQIMIERPKTTE